MNRTTTTQEQAPNGFTPLRAKYLLHRTVIIITDATDSDLKKILDVIEKNEHPPHITSFPFSS